MHVYHLILQGVPDCKPIIKCRQMLLTFSPCTPTLLELFLTPVCHTCLILSARAHHCVSYIHVEAEGFVALLPRNEWHQGGILGEESGKMSDTRKEQPK